MGGLEHLDHMNSKTFKEDDFVDFHPLKELVLLNMPENEGHVLVFIDEILLEKPASDILCIGRAKKRVKRIFGGCLGGNGERATEKIHECFSTTATLKRPQ